MATGGPAFDEVDLNGPYSADRPRTPSPFLSKPGPRSTMKTSDVHHGRYGERSFIQHMRRIQRRLKDWGWFWETSSCIIMSGTCGAIIGVLATHNNKPVPDLPYGITINALVSVLITILGWAMTVPIEEGLGQLKWVWYKRARPLNDLVVFDEASRDALGSARLFLHKMPIHLASFGAALTILSLAIGPFVQQVIQQSPHRVVVNAPASMPLCGSNDYWDAGPVTPMYSNGQLTLGSLGAIYQGIFQSNENETISARCPTGNCTFDTYQSFGFCSKCADLTDKIQESAQCNHSDSTGCEYSLANKNVTITQNTLQTKMVAATGDDLVALPSLPSFINFTALLLPGDRPSAIECSLYFCVVAYNTQVTAGDTFENGQEAPSNWTPVPTEVKSNMTITPTSCYASGKHYQPPYPPDTNCTYSVGYYSFNALNQTLSDILTGSFAMPSVLTPSWSSNPMEALYGSNGSISNIEQIFSRVADTLTKHARKQICQTKFPGKAFSREPYLHVKWAWMALPIALVCLTLVFFLATVIRTRHDQIWKGSPLPLLYFGLAREVRESIEPTSLPSDMDDTARRVRVRFEQTDEGLRLSRPELKETCRP